MSDTRQLFESFQLNLAESEQLNEKINKDNIEVNRIISNPNAGKNREKIQDMGYELRTNDDGKVFAIRNPKTGRWVDPSYYRVLPKDERNKIDFKNMLDTDRESNQGVYTKRDIPKSIATGKTRDNYVTANRAEANQYADGISQNIKDYKRAVLDKENAKHSLKYSDDSIKYYEDQVKKAQEDLDFQKRYVDRRRKDADDAEAKRKDILHKVRVKRGITESGLANLKTVEDYEDLDEFNDALEDDKNTITSSLHDIKPKLNLSGSVSFIDSIIPLVSDELNRCNAD